MDSYTEADLTAMETGNSTIHVLMPGERYPWRFIKTTAHHWKRTRGHRSQWATHEQLAQLIEQGTLTNSLGEPQ